jgi:hypothetical protein
MPFKMISPRIVKRNIDFSKYNKKTIKRKTRLYKKKVKGISGIDLWNRPDGSFRFW